MIRNKDFMLENPINLDIQRSRFSLNHKVTMTFDPGLVVPILAYSDVLPGDTFSCKLSWVIRSTTPIAPIMDDAQVQVEFYFVPHDLVLSRASMSPTINDSTHSFKSVIGAQDSLLNMPLPDDTAVLPRAQFLVDSSDTNRVYHYKQSIGHYLGYPCVPYNKSCTDFFMNPFPLLAYYQVWNDNYRDPNLWEPVVYSITGDVVRFATNPRAGMANYQSNMFLDKLAHACRYHGYFGSLLPWPQRNSSSVTLPLGEVANVVANDNLWHSAVAAGTNSVGFGSTDHNQLSSGVRQLSIDVGGSVKDGHLSIYENDGAGSGNSIALDRTNLVADLRNATQASVNTVRFAFQLQKWYEALARGGNRLSDMVRMFGVTPSNYNEGRAEYLGGKRVPLNVTQVENTSGSTMSVGTQLSIGSTGAYSLTSDSDHFFTKSFDTWGTIIGVCIVRHHDAFGNAFSKMLKRRSKFDYYWPQFANLGEQPVTVDELFFDYMSTSYNKSYNEAVLGYQEYAAEYRYLSDRVVGEVNPEFGSIPYWTYADKFTVGAAGSILASSTSVNDLTLDVFLDASLQANEFNRTLQVSNSTAGFTFLGQFYFDITAARPMPLYSIPGFIDHH